MEVYRALYSPEIEKLEEAAPYMVEEGAFRDWLAEGRILFVGDGAAKCQPLLQGQPGAWVLPELLSTAAGVAAGAWPRWQAGDFADLATLEPDYIKPFASTKPKPRF
jgi:tRNA threonylcarbamoyladenosine biosynthesis protein TsaB